MFYNQDDEENFLSDKRVEEVYQEEPVTTRRRGGYMGENNTPKKEEEQRIKKAPAPQRNDDDDEEENDTIINITIVIVFIIVLVLAGIIVSKIFFGKDKNKTQDSSTKTETVAPTNDTKKEETKTETKTNTNTNTNTQTNTTSDTYDAYPVTIESVVYKKGGNFYNNNEKITGDKVYVEYKQISGLKNTTKQAEINTKLKEKVIALYDKNYLGDSNTLFVDIHTKISVNFNTLSYVIYRRGEDIDGKHILEKVESINIRLSDAKEIAFEDVFVSGTNITDVYNSYVKGKVSAYYYTPEKLYVYDSNYKETMIDMSKYKDKISIMTKYKEDKDIFTSQAKSQKMFTTLSGTVSEETKERAFKQN